MSAPVNLPWGFEELPAKVTLVSRQGPEWLAAKCRRKECPLEHAPFECPFSKSCANVWAADWESVSAYIEEDEDGQSS
jgi:hypothetical protein